MLAIPTMTSGAQTIVRMISSVRAVPVVSGCGKSRVAVMPWPDSSATASPVAISARTSSLLSLGRATLVWRAPQCGHTIAWAFTRLPQDSQSVTAMGV